MTTIKEEPVLNESPDSQTIISLARAIQDAWNRGDAAGFASPFTDDASFIAWNGAHGYGRQAIEDAHVPLLAGPLAGSRMVLIDEDGPESLRFIRPDVAIMVTSGAVTLADQSATGPDHESVQTFVLAKNGDRWQMTAFHNTRKQVP
jgi:uncharacterized protein (TIGR02246 family)